VETRGAPEVPSPLHYHNRLYLVKNGGIVSFRNVQTGRLNYQQHLGSSGAKELLSKTIPAEAICNEVHKSAKK
jgi:hypothetical protein